MDVVTAILLGILQGLTEFFPVSSSGHLALFGHWFGLEEPDLTFDVLVHLATLAAIIVYFRNDWIQLFKVLLRKADGDLPPMIIPLLILSMIPAGFAGVLGKDAIEWFHGSIAWVGVFLWITGAVLLAGLKAREGSVPLQKLNWKVVAVMGVAQAFAILPGISRSGSTIMAGLFCGMQRTAAARFSFLMAVPVISGAGLLTAVDVWKEQGGVDPALLPAYGAGFVAAMFSGFFALMFLMKLLEGNRFFYFGFYCLLMGVVAMADGLL